MTPDELTQEAARRMAITTDTIIAMKGKELSKDYVQGYSQGALDYLETLQTIIAELN